MCACTRTIARTLASLPWFSAWLALACAAVQPAHATGRKRDECVRYRVRFPSPASQYVHVEASIPSRSEHTDLALPAWTPGSYRVRDFAKHVFDLRAQHAEGPALLVTSVDKQTWRVHNRKQPFVVSYRVYAATRSVRASHVDDTHASLNGASVFVFEPGKTSRPREVSVVAPEPWRVYAPLNALEGQPAVFSAPDYDTLVDSPFEVGTPRVDRFEIQGTRFEYVLTGAERAPVDAARLVRDAKTIATTLGEMMGGFPLQRYMFNVHVTERGGGGLEHASSAMMMLRRTSFDRVDGYTRASQLTAHEFFHLWNVKRIHDQVLSPFDYLRENYTRLLWFHEGLTETIEGQAMRRSGLWTSKQYLDHIAKRYSDYLAKPGRNAMPLSEVSFRAWTHAYQPENNHPNVTISYYEKGDLVGVALDLTIRMRSQGRGSLVGMFRRLMRDFGTPDKGITQADVVAAASAEAEADLSEFFARYIDGTQPLPLPHLLEQAGLVVKVRPAWQRAKPRSPTDRKSHSRAWAGLQLRENTVDNVVPQGPAAEAGLMRGDEVVAIDGVRTPTKNAVQRELTRAGVGSTVAVTLFRGPRLLERDIAIAENPLVVYSLALPDNPSPVLAGWLNLETAPADPRESAPRPSETARRGDEMRPLARGLFGDRRTSLGRVCNLVGFERQE